MKITKNNCLMHFSGRDKKWNDIMNNISNIMIESCKIHKASNQSRIQCEIWLRNTSRLGIFHIQFKRIICFSIIINEILFKNVGDILGLRSNVAYMRVCNFNSQEVEKKKYQRVPRSFILNNLANCNFKSSNSFKLSLVIIISSTYNENKTWPLELVLIKK